MTNAGLRVVTADGQLVKPGTAKTFNTNVVVGGKNEGNDNSHCFGKSDCRPMVSTDQRTVPSSVDSSAAVLRAQEFVSTVNDGVSQFSFGATPAEVRANADLERCVQRYGISGLGGCMAIWELGGATADLLENPVVQSVGVAGTVVRHVAPGGECLFAAAGSGSWGSCAIDIAIEVGTAGAAVGVGAAIRAARLRGVANAADAVVDINRVSNPSNFGGEFIDVGVRSSPTRIPAVGDALLEPGPWANGSVPSVGPGRILAAERGALNRLGAQYGCHSCGTADNGVKSGNWVGDHMPISSAVAPGTPQVLYPQCQTCSNDRGLHILNLIRKGLWPPQ